MAFTDYPNPKESIFVQRKVDNSFYEEIHITGSDLVIYHDSTGLLTADKISVWASKYSLGSGSVSGSTITTGSTYPITASWSQTASYALNGGGSGVISGGSYNISSSWASSSLSASYAPNNSLIYGSIITSIINTNILVLEVATSSFGYFFNYTAISESNARAGQIFGINNGGTVTYTEVTTTDIGNTSGVTMSLDINSNKIQLLTNTNTLSWSLNASIVYFQ